MEETKATVAMPITVTFDVNTMAVERHDGYDFGLVGVIAPMVAERIVKTISAGNEWSGLAQRIRDIRDDEIREQLRPAIVETLAASIQMTNAYGEPVGKTATLREVVAETGRKMLAEPQRDRNGYGTSETLVRRLIREEVEAAFGRELKAALDEAKTEIRAAVQAKGAAVLAETIQRMAASS